MQQRKCRCKGKNKKYIRNVNKHETNKCRFVCDYVQKRCDGFIALIKYKCSDSTACWLKNDSQYADRKRKDSKCNLKVTMWFCDNYYLQQQPWVGEWAGQSHFPWKQEKQVQHALRIAPVCD